MDIHVISSVTSAVWICSGKLVTNEKHFHSVFRKKVTVAIIWITRMIKQCGHCIAQEFFSVRRAHFVPVFIFVYYRMRRGKYLVFFLVCELDKEW